VHTAVESLRRGGRLGYWSATSEPKFVNTLKHAGLVVEVHSVRARPTGGAYHTVIVAQQRQAAGMHLGTPGRASSE
jgi:hypothetical protein